MKKITPIIVVGMNRSGTKWLSNILCNNQDVICVQSKKACGVLESVILSGVMESKFDLSFPEEFAASMELLFKSNYFKIAQAEKEMFYKMNPRPNNFYEIYRIMMENYAKRNNKKFWLQKTSPFQALKVLKYFSEGYFVVIKRNIVDTLKSQFQRYSTRGIKKSLYKKIYSYVFQEKILANICKRPNVVYVQYEKLIENPDEQIRNVCDFIGIRFEPEMLNVTYRKNTSFKNESERNTIITGNNEIFLKIISKVFRLLPFFTMKGQRKVKMSFKNRPIPFNSGTYRHILDKYK
jgi:hypothetical protein